MSMQYCSSDSLCVRESLLRSRPEFLQVFPASIVPPSFLTCSDDRHHISTILPVVLHLNSVMTVLHMLVVRLRRRGIYNHWGTVTGRRRTRIPIRPSGGPYEVQVKDESYSEVEYCDLFQCCQVLCFFIKHNHTFTSSFHPRYLINGVHTCMVSATRNVTQA